MKFRKHYSKTGRFDLASIHVPRYNRPGGFTFEDQAFMGVVGQHPVSSGGVVATDNFTRANASTLGSNYTPCGQGSGPYDGMSISSNTAIGATGLSTMSAWTANTFHNDQYSKATYFSAAVGSKYLQVAVRLTGAGATLNGYQITTDSANWFLSKITAAGTATNLTTGTSAMTAGDTLEIKAVGTTISAYHNGTLLGSVTDSSYASGSAGIGGYQTSQASALEVGNVD